MKKAFFFFLFALPISAFAQIHIPVLDLAIKPGVTSTTDLGNTVLINLTAEANVHINQFVSAGGFYSRSLFGQYEQNDNIDLLPELKQLTYGARIRVSTGRITKFRPYAFITLTKLEIVEKVTDELNFAGNWVGITYGGGFMIRLSDRLYLNLIEVEYIPAKGEFFFILEDLNFISIRLGANYIIGKKR